MISDMGSYLFGISTGLACSALIMSTMIVFSEDVYRFNLDQNKVKAFEAGQGTLSELCSEFSEKSEYLATRDGVEYEVVASCQPTPKAMPKP